MVLEEATSPATDFADDSSVDQPPSDDERPLSSTELAKATTERIQRMDMSQYARPLPVLGPVFGYTQDNLKQIVLANAYRFAVAAGRPLSDSEVDATAMHTAKRYSISSFASPLGVIAGLYRSETTKQDFRFPFYKPDLAKFDFRRIPGTTVSGEAAYAFWNLMRRMSYQFVSVPAARIIVFSYATSVSIVGQMRDTRLHDVVEHMQEMAQEEIQARRSGMPGSTSTSQRMRIPPPVQQPQQEESAWDTARETAPSPRSHSSLFDDDDASPTAGSEPWAPVSASQPSSPSSSSDSAWDRVRKGSPPVPSRVEAARSAQVTTGDAWARVRSGNSPPNRQRGPNSASSEGGSSGWDSFGADSPQSGGVEDNHVSEGEQRGGWRR